MKIEEVGNNKYRKHGSQEVIYAPNIDTAEKRFKKQMLQDFKKEFYVLEQMLFHKGFTVASHQLADMKLMWKELCDE